MTKSKTPDVPDKHPKTKTGERKMKRRAQIIGLSTSILWLATGAPRASAATTLSQPVLEVVDTNPDSNIFQADLTVDEQDVIIAGTTVHTLIYKDANNPAAYAGASNGIPIPHIVANVGDEIIVTLTNNLEDPCAAIACDTSLHWHGIEVDNDSDGSGVTQNHLTPGQTYTYRFKTFRPGIFFFHPHMKPGPQTFAGVYGAFIVKDPNEAALVTDGKIPSAANTHTIVLSDIEFDADGDVGYVDGGNAVPWAMLHEDCAAGNMMACRTLSDADTVLINGQAATASTPKITAKSGAGIRLRLINAATNRYFRLVVTGNGTDNNLYRIGGEGGFLEKVRLEGGILGTWNTKYNKGEILLPTSARADVVIVPTGNNGDMITVSGIGYNRNGVNNNNPAGDLLFIEIDNNLDDTPFAIAEGNDVLGDGGVENIKSAPLDFYTDPVPALPGPGSGAGSANETITMNSIMSGHLAIDGVQGHFEDSGPDFTQVPFQGATRYARTGDTLELKITQQTQQHHPFHHHGFSVQPVRVLNSADDSVLFEYDFDEFQDVVDIANGQSVVVRMRIDDRPRITDNRQEAGAPAPNQFFTSGGAAGRWVFHCHMFIHAAVGMISELVVVDADRDGDGLDTSTDCNDFNPLINSNAAEICDDGVDNDCDGLIDEDTTAPDVSAATDLTTLTPANHQLVNVGLSVAGTDACDPDPVVTVTVFSDEDPKAICFLFHAEAATDIAPETLRLRAERNHGGDGRVYLILITVRDATGNVGHTCKTVTVAFDNSEASKTSVAAQAAAAEAECLMTGSPPDGFFAVGVDGGNDPGNFFGLTCCPFSFSFALLLPGLVGLRLLRPRRRAVPLGRADV